MTFKELTKKVNQSLQESPMSIKGDAPFEIYSESMIGSISERIMNKDYKLVKSDFIKKLDLYFHKNGTLFILGGFYVDETSKTRFAIMNELSFKNKQLYSKQKQFKNKKFISIQTIHTCIDWRGNKISTELYKYIINQGYSIISDSINYEGAVNLWKGFLSIPNSTIYIYDEIEDKIISKWTKNTPDSQVWSNNTSKMRIKLVFVAN